MKKIIFSSIIAFSMLTISSVHTAQSNERQYYWIKVATKDKFQRSIVAETGAAVEIVKDDYVIAYGNDVELKKLQKLGWVVAYSNLALEDFPVKDGAYHNFTELSDELNRIASANRDIVSLSSVTTTPEGRNMWVMRISGDLATASQKPGVIYLGGHHAREHLSVEMPLMLAQYLIKGYRDGDARIVRLLNSRDIHIIPVVNPDGSEFDIKDGSYKMWRKNRTRNSDGTFGVDLNRNYGYQWGTGGSSSDPSSDTFKGPQPFSEVESRGIRDYIERNTNITELLSFHSYSKLILYPWGHKYAAVETANDLRVFQTMARKMAEWNGYTPEQASELYIASGDTCDWAYGAHKIFAFTFELDPSSNGFGGGGFYPGPDVIQPVFQKNIEPALYMLEYADNPYRVLNIGIGPISP